MVICGLAAVVGQASKAPLTPSPPPPPPFSFSNEITPLSSYGAAASCARALSVPPVPVPPSVPTLDYVHSFTEHMCSAVR